MSSYFWRRLMNLAMTGVCAGAVVVALVPLVSVFWLLFAKGFSALSWSLFWFKKERDTPASIAKQILSILRGGIDAAV